MNLINVILYIGTLSMFRRLVVEKRAGPIDCVKLLNCSYVSCRFAHN